MVQTDNSQSHWFSLSKYILWFFYNFYEEIVKESFNTSHVTLYRRGYDMSYMSKRSFNTSHVTLYQRRDTTEQLESAFQYITCYSLSVIRYNTPESSSVSIHHMLLFIDIQLATIPDNPMFQYITCYSLSGIGQTP